MKSLISGRILFDKFDSRKVPEKHYYVGVRGGIGFSMDLENIDSSTEVFILYLPIEKTKNY